MAAATLSLTESNEFTAIRTFLLNLLPSGIEVVRGQVNRVGEPMSNDFVVFWPLSQNRLSTNITTYSDNYVLGTVNGNVLTVNQVLNGSVPLNQLLFDKNGSLDPSTIILLQLNGIPNGIGDYQISTSRTMTSSDVFYCGVREDLMPNELSVQLDIHGPNSSDNATTIMTLFRSEYGVDAFQDTGFDIVPLYCLASSQVPFINAENQYEDRWILDLRLQANPVVGTLQQFADQLQETKIIVDGGFASTTGPIIQLKTHT